jgi:hypothetical protein
VKIAYRFSIAYLGLYALATQIVGGVFLFPGFPVPALGTVWPMRQITVWCAQHIFGIASPLVYIGNSGDTVFHWVQMLWLLVAAAIIAAIWWATDRRRSLAASAPSHEAVLAWFRLFIRFCLAAQMFYYGMAKVIPTQFPPPSLVTLVEPVGNLSLADLLWTFIGASTPYQIFTGCAEMAVGLMLLAPRTTALGALIGLADMTQVFLLNMTYDFGLKQISLHLILMSLFLLAPDLKRLASLFLFNRPAGTFCELPLFRTPRANRIAVAAQIAFGVYLIGMFTSIALRSWYAEGGPGSPRSALYGIWDVDQMSVDGAVRAPQSNDYDLQWRRVIFDADGAMVFQRPDDSFAHYNVAIDQSARSLAVRKGNSRTWKAAFTYIRPADDQLILAGEMDGHTIRVRLQLVPLDTFRLLNSRFRWVRPPDPFAG